MTGRLDYLTVRDSYYYRERAAINVVAASAPRNPDRVCDVQLRF